MSKEDIPSLAAAALEVPAFSLSVTESLALWQVWISLHCSSPQPLSGRTICNWLLSVPGSSLALVLDRSSVACCRWLRARPNKALRPYVVWTNLGLDQRNSYLACLTFNWLKKNSNSQAVLATKFFFFWFQANFCRDKTFTEGLGGDKTSWQRQFLNCRKSWKNAGLVKEASNAQAPHGSAGPVLVCPFWVNFWQVLASLFLKTPIGILFGHLSVSWRGMSPWHADCFLLAWPSQSRVCYQSLAHDKMKLGASHSGRSKLTILKRVTVPLALSLFIRACHAVCRSPHSIVLSLLALKQPHRARWPCQQVLIPRTILQSKDNGSEPRAYRRPRAKYRHKVCRDAVIEGNDGSIHPSAFVEWLALLKLYIIHAGLA